MNCTLFKINPIPSLIFDIQTLEILEVNGAAVDHYKYKRNEFLKLTLEDITAADVCYMSSIRKALKKKKGDTYLGIFAMQTKEGTILKMEINGHKVDFKDRQCFLMVCQEVKKNREKESTRSQNERRLSTLMQGSFDLVGVIDTKGFYTYMSPSSAAITGIAAEDFIGKDAFGYIHPDDIQHTLDSLKEVLTQERVVVAPYRAKNHNDEWCWVETVLKNMLDDPAINGIVVNSRDITESFKAKEHLIEISERLYLATTSAKMGIWDWDVINDNLTWDNKMYALYGLKEEDFTGAVSAWQHGLHPEDAARSTQELKDSLKGAREFNTEFRVIWPDRTVRYLEAHAVVTRDKEGRAVRMIGSNVDVTDRKKAEENILKANERFEKVTQATKDAIWDWDIANDTFYRSDAFKTFLGEDTSRLFSPTAFGGDHLYVHDREMIIQSIDKALADPLATKWINDYSVSDKHGKIHYLNDRGIIIRDKDGKALRMVGAMSNITGQKQSEQENKFKANLLKTVSEAAIATDLDGVVNYWNKAAETIFGWTAEEAIGKYVNQLTLSDVIKEQGEQIMAKLRRGETWFGEFEALRKDGSTVLVRVSNAPVYDDTNNLVGMVGISSDITQEAKNKKLLKQYTHQLERTNKKLKEIAWTQSHEVRAPLSRIMGIINLIELEGGAIDQLDFWLEQLKISTQEMDAIVRNIVDEAQLLDS
ncbi:PAS domain-containing protein [Leeuwenhoekiella polynyae]|uniref:histidine kinase n=1 Tax=Leeuwenhoekiella polynyae TaxID=1550906 RepID=A0A4Q0NSF1_9FLAO|nr:PAS domain-containing protein [Leeuwenhoekiella polynyae]RXG13017.1 PAS domain S-box-containing protein [Leeuwenhoekiella polynyae]